jgi:hypothetical protein
MMSTQGAALTFVAICLAVLVVAVIAGIVSEVAT